MDEIQFVKYVDDLEKLVNTIGLGALITHALTGREAELATAELRRRCPEWKGAVLSGYLGSITLKPS